MTTAHLDQVASSGLTHDPVNYASPSARRQVVIVHAGARDSYQLALAMSEAGMLKALVTDLYSLEDRKWTRTLHSLIPRAWVSLINKRKHPDLPSSRVRTFFWRGLWTLLLQKWRGAPSGFTQRTARRLDSVLGRKAGRIATSAACDLVSYSYYGYDAFKESPHSRILFQVHPHPLSVRRILTEELALHPECADSLNQEWEIALPESDFRRLIDETRMAQRFLVASSFTRSTLIENGACSSDIEVIPYGVDLDLFCPPPRPRPIDGPLKLLFVGRINQRKGLAYLLEALRLLDSKQLTVTIIGRVVDDLKLFDPYRDILTIRPSVSTAELVEAYRQADLFVFPSVAEGFGQVLLEALASGLPILSTTHTAAPDLIEDGVQGFILEPRRADLIAEKIRWSLENREALRQMGVDARARAQEFGWDRFRSRAVDAITRYQHDTGPQLTA